MRVLVTGATGFIGRHLAARLATAEDVQAIGTTRDSARDPGMRRLLLPAIGTEDAAGWATWLAPLHLDAVIHLAAAGVHPADRDAKRLIAVNVEWPATLVRAAAAVGVRTLVLAGSSAEYAPGADTRPLREDAPLASADGYGATKACGGRKALEVGAAFGVDVVLLRFFNVFGEGEAAHRLLPSIASAWSTQTPIALSAGTQIRDFVEVRDACAAIEIAMRMAGDGRLESGTYNISTGIGTSVATFARLVSEAIGADPAWLRFGALPMRPDELPWLVGDPRRFEAATGWRASSDLRETVARATRATLAALAHDGGRLHPPASGAGSTTPNSR